MLFGITFLSLFCTFSAFLLKDGGQPVQEVNFKSSLSKDVDFAHRFNSFASDACSCKNGRCVKDSRGNQKCLCKPKHSMKDKDCELCYCGKNGKCIFTETISEQSKGIHYEKKCVCDTGYADKNGTCTECLCGINSKCEFEYLGKNCYCIEGYAELHGVCTECSCGEGGYCEFQNGEKICTCFDGYQFDGKVCKECDCGENGVCKLVDDKKTCYCNDGFEFDGYFCSECDCGIQGKCTIEGDEKKCECASGYSEKNGICEECDCGPKGTCGFENGSKRCYCRGGTADKNGKCTDPCETNLCQNDGVCVGYEDGEGFTCLCKEHWKGTFCEESIPAPPDLCQDASIDAATTTADGRTYVFKGDYYWEVKETGIGMNTGIPDGYPRKISEDWDGLPGHLDAAFTSRGGKTFFFKKNEYWRFRNKKMDNGYPVAISVEFEGIPDSIDAALVWSGDGRIYFFKGSSYWRYDSCSEPHVSPSYPQPISWWEGVPDNIDAALPWLHNTTHFFKGGSYYRFDDIPATVHKNPPPYPRPSSTWWFGC